MIAYDLQCSNGHRFEGWFEDSKSFDQQNSQGLVSCPVCENTVVSKLPSTFAIKGASTESPLMSQGDPEALAVLGRQIADYVQNNFDNVGADFAQEALKMHYGVSEPRNIRGVSTPQEEETLKNEGIDFYKFPVPQKAPDNDPEST